MAKQSLINKYTGGDRDRDTSPSTPPPPTPPAPLPEPAPEPIATPDPIPLVDEFASETTSHEPQAAPILVDDDATDLVSGPLVAVEAGFASMLEFRFRNGSSEAFPYSYLARVTFDPKTGLTLTFPGTTVSITGRNLKPLSQAITSHTAIAICQSDVRFDERGDAPWVESITIDDGPETTGPEGA